MIIEVTNTLTYCNQRAAEDRVRELEVQRYALIEELEELNEGLDSFRLHALIQRLKETP